MKARKWIILGLLIPLLAGPAAKLIAGMTGNASGEPGFVWQIQLIGLFGLIAGGILFYGYCASRKQMRAMPELATYGNRLLSMLALVISAALFMALLYVFA